MVFEAEEMRGGFTELLSGVLGFSLDVRKRFFYCRLVASLFSDGILFNGLLATPSQIFYIHPLIVWSGVTSLGSGISLKLIEIRGDTLNAESQNSEVQDVQDVSPWGGVGGTECHSPVIRQSS